MHFYKFRAIQAQKIARSGPSGEFSASSFDHVTVRAALPEETQASTETPINPFKFIGDAMQVLGMQADSLLRRLKQAVLK